MTDFSSRMTEGRYNQVLRERDEARAIARRAVDLLRGEEDEFVAAFDALPWAKEPDTPPAGRS